MHRVVRAARGLVGSHGIAPSLPSLGSTSHLRPISRSGASPIQSTPRSPRLTSQISSWAFHMSAEPVEKRADDHDASPTLTLLSDEVSTLRSASSLPKGVDCLSDPTPARYVSTFEEDDDTEGRALAPQPRPGRRSVARPRAYPRQRRLGVRYEYVQLPRPVHLRLELPARTARRARSLQGAPPPSRRRKGSRRDLLPPPITSRRPPSSASPTKRAARRSSRG